jgi:hypothetical protein
MRTVERVASTASLAEQYRVLFGIEHALTGTLRDEDMYRSKVAKNQK